MLYKNDEKKDDDKKSDDSENDMNNEEDDIDTSYAQGWNLINLDSKDWKHNCRSKINSVQNIDKQFTLEQLINNLVKNEE